MHFSNINIDMFSNNKKHTVYSSNVSKAQSKIQQRPKSWMRLKRRQNLERNIDTSTNISAKREADSVKSRREAFKLK